MPTLLPSASRPPRSGPTATRAQRRRPVRTGEDLTALCGGGGARSAFILAGHHHTRAGRRPHGPQQARPRVRIRNATSAIARARPGSSIPATHPAPHARPDPGRVASVRPPFGHCAQARAARGLDRELAGRVPQVNRSTSRPIARTFHEAELHLLPTEMSAQTPFAPSAALWRARVGAGRRLSP